MLDMAAGSIFYSDDDGASWSFYSRSPFPYDPPAGSETRARMRVVGDDLILVTEASGTIQHWASTDLGVSFRLIESASTHTSTSLAVLPGGVVAVIYLDASGNLDSKIIAGASGSIVGAETVVIDAAPPTFVAIEAWADADGIAYIAAATSAAPGGTILYSSTDGARTWTRNTGGYLNRSSAAGSVADTIDRLAVAPVLGSAIVIAGVSSSPGTWDGSLFALFCGGWTNVTAGTSAGSKVATARGGWDQTWFAYTDPYGVDAPNTVWLMGGTPGSIVSAEFLVTTSATTTSTRAAQTLQNTTDTDGSLALQWECKVTSGGSLAAANVSVTAGISESAGSPSWDYHARINMLTTGFRVLDVDTGGTLADVTIDLTTPLVFLMDIEGSALNVWYRRIEDENWTVAFSGSLANGGGGTTRSIVWGHSVASSASSTWYSFAFRQGAACEHTPQTIAGKALGSVAYPIPSIGTAAQVAHLRLRHGPARIGETYTIDAAHDHGIDQVFPQISPSRDSAWRSTAVAEQIIALDLSKDTVIGQSWITTVYFGGVNFRTAYLETQASGGAWSTLATYDGATGYFALTYSLSGDVLIPDVAATSTAGRYLQANELAGGFVILDTGGTPKARRIAGNSAGHWTQNTTVIPRIRLEGIDGTEHAGGVGARCAIVWPSGVLVALQTQAAANQKQKYRIRIPVQDVVDSYLSAGVISVGGLIATGKQYGRGYSIELTPNTDTRVTPYGTRYATQRGPNARAVTVSWQDGADMSSFRDATQTTDWISPSGSVAPTVVLNDVYHQLSGLLDECAGGELQCLWLGDVPAANGTITDRTLYLWGNLEGSVQMNHVTGDEGATELVRVESLTVRETR
jgi:hypothetical protein